jgi:hypothetical protein
LASGPLSRRHAHDRVQPEEGQRRRGIIEIDFAVLDLLLEGSGKGARIDLSPAAKAVFGLTPAPTPPCVLPAMAR